MIDLKEGVYKFVKSDAGTYFFHNINDEPMDHIDMVPPQGRAVAAGAIAVGKSALVITGKWSSTLNIGSGPDEFKEIEEILGKKFL
jgi:hypothetical protein